MSERSSSEAVWPYTVDEWDSHVSRLRAELSDAEDRWREAKREGVCPATTSDDQHFEAFIGGVESVVDDRNVDKSRVRLSYEEWKRR